MAEFSKSNNTVLSPQRTKEDKEYSVLLRHLLLPKHCHVYLATECGASASANRPETIAQPVPVRLRPSRLLHLDELVERIRPWREPINPPRFPRGSMRLIQSRRYP